MPLPSPEARTLRRDGSGDQIRPADLTAITTIELALDTADSARIAPMWAALLTGSIEARGRGTSYTVIADQDGNRACACTSLPPASASEDGAAP